MRPRLALLGCLAFDAWVLADGPRLAGCFLVAESPQPRREHPNGIGRLAEQPPPRRIDHHRIARHDSLARLHAEIYDSLVADAIPRMAPVTLEGPTLIAVYPEPHLLVWPWADVSLDGMTAAFRGRQPPYRSVAATAGFTFVERYNRAVLLFDPLRDAWSRLDLPSDWLGWLVAAPGLVPHVVDASIAPPLLAGFLRSYAAAFHERDWRRANRGASPGIARDRPRNRV